MWKVGVNFFFSVAFFFLRFALRRANKEKKRKIDPAELDRQVSQDAERDDTAVRFLGRMLVCLLVFSFLFFYVGR